jgi:phosphate transport system substrate-binding protein
VPSRATGRGPVRNKLISLTVVALVASGTVVVPSAGASSRLVGAGSSLVAPLVEEWGATFQAFHDTVVSYTPAGSQAGINDVTTRAVDFAASDAPMTSAQASACNRCYQIPWSLSAVGIGYHIHGVGYGLYLTGPVLAEIYLGQITHWNDFRIKALNQRVHLPALKITPISTSAGDTYPFTTYLSKVSSTWRASVGSGLSVSFPAGESVDSDSAATSVLEATDGAIAYVGTPYLVAHGLPAAGIENAAGRFEFPNLTEIETAAKTIRRVPANDAVQIVDPPSSARIAYPISTFTYAIVPANAAQKSALAQWISYALGLGQQLGPRLGFAALPPVVLRASDATLHAFSSS